MADFDLDGLTDEQLLALIKNAGKPEVKNKVKVQTIGGEVIEADSHEALNQLLVQKLAAASQSREEEDPETIPQVNQGPKLPKFDYKKFEETFVKDPVAGLEYADTCRFGAPMTQLLPQMAQALGLSMKKLQELETQQFIDQTDGYEPSVENRKALERVMTERGWQPSRQTLDDAFAIASAKGMIKVKGQKQEQRHEAEEQFIPPRGRSASDISNADQEFMNNLNNLSDEKIYELANKAGIGPRR